MAKRPVIGMADGADVDIKGLGATVNVPKGWSLLGRCEVDAANYRFPWFRSKLGLMEFAVGLGKWDEDLESGVHRHLMKTRLVQASEIEKVRLERGGVAHRVGFEGGVVRYYFINFQSQIVYVHLFGSSELESIVRKGLFIESEGAD